MQCFLSLALLAALSGPVPEGDLVITTSKQEGAKVSTSVTWIGMDRLRIEDGDSVTIVRADLKKMYMLDTTAKTCSTLELPFDMKKYTPAEYAPMIEQMMGQMKVTVTPTTESKRVKDWNATRFTMTMSMPMGMEITQEIWATKDIGVDLGAYQGMFAASLATNPFGGAALANEMKKVDGLPVLTERTMSMRGKETKSREEVTSVEHKEPPAGLYDIPAGFTEKAYDPMEDSPMGGGGRGKLDRGPHGG